MSQPSFLFFLSFRILSIFFIRNYDYPDQYWQGPEIAHKIYFGYGYQTWEWTISQPIRNPFFQSILSLGYFFTSLLPSQYQDCLVLLTPSFIQAFIAGITDIYLFKTCEYFYGHLTLSQIILIYSNWFYLGMMNRMYGNSFETFLIIISFYYWIKRKYHDSNDLKSRFFVILAYVSRPTSIILWAFIWPFQLFTDKGKYFGTIFFKFILKNFITILLMLMSSFIIGSVYYGKPTLTQLNFIKYNFIQKWSQLYGINSPFFYFFFSIPLIFGPSLLLLTISIFALFKKNKLEKQIVKKEELKNLAFLTLVYLLFSSLSSHKQHRFILPIIPFLLILTIYSLKLPHKIFKLIIIVAILFNLFLFFSVNTFGKYGSFQAMKFLQSKIPAESKNKNIIFLGQSHFIPAYSVLHRNVTLKIPDSSPMKMSIKQSQNDLLYENPKLLYEILTEQMGDPDYIIGQGKYAGHYEKYIIGLFNKQGEWRHCNIFEEYFIGFDSVILYSLKNQRDVQ